MHRDDPEFGYRFLADEVHDAGFAAAQRTVWKICAGNGWWSSFGKEKTRKRGKIAAPAHDDLVRRDFTAPGPNQLWLTDLTEHRTDEGKLYLCAIKDVWSNRIVGYSISDRMQSQIAVDALESALARRGGTVAGCRLHSDRGSQFRSQKLQQALWGHQMIGSMGQVGSAGDCESVSRRQAAWLLLLTDPVVWVSLLLICRLPAGAAPSGAGRAGSDLIGA